MVLLWYGGTGTSIGNLSYTWDANKNKTSETIGGTMSGYGFTSRSRAINFHSRIAQTFDASTPCAKSSIAHEFSFDTSLHLTTDTLPLSNASYIDEPVVRKAAGTSGTIHYYHRNGQYSITAMTTSTGAVAERYAYTAYGQPTIASASGSVLTSSSVGNRYTYTGREWDETLGIHHFRARWMSPLAGRFLGRDPIGYSGSEWALCEFMESATLFGLDYSGKIKGYSDDEPAGEDPKSFPNFPPIPVDEWPRPIVEFEDGTEKCRCSLRGNRIRPSSPSTGQSPPEPGSPLVQSTLDEEVTVRYESTCIGEPDVPCWGPCPGTPCSQYVCYRCVKRKGKVGSNTPYPHIRTEWGKCNGERKTTRNTKCQRG